MAHEKVRLRRNDCPMRLLLVTWLTSMQVVARERGGQVVRSWLRNPRAPGSKPDSTKDPLCLRACRTFNLTCAKNPPAGVARKFGEENASSGLALLSLLRFKITGSVPKWSSSCFKKGT
ncbi:hypothetical protein AVEN_173802-1 [Araneus ventricosus]|uniref:Secreted protein n=1 Tax=Araneus ventricosus TaxID=182803 RepID=A0A4Y2EP72_ARAVE|nr:hypothetical protein AVEN_97996-1 [Araneus ventricosus]GBM31093.1 hypothetical protein AVEN_129862-1 [Araneus ventricosus]GBM31110.1 hypothetical protein AVEN_138414-1 [Araneus ventricosus]GBM31160.1 hypothetical protein AVEN_173802-1 [Araneus ventricosus]